MLTDIIIPQVQAILSAVAGVGANIHSHIRIANTDAQFKTLFFDAAEGRIHGYTITREKTDVVEKDVGAALDLHSIVIRGYMGVQDLAVPTSTELLMQKETEDLRAAFFAKRHLEDNLGNRKVFWCERIVVRNFASAMFAGMLCHYVESLLVVHDYPIS